ncbi:DUF1697 domain-containing protein [Microbacterium maritypicum]|uniref:DUF1697 domain-containing protein n=1 Tax=Microbacterium maritypicum MF109 TaxID=1333857 RepID=T5KRL5_MICMQ|nr:DUF1697 domain-containing protein [Microbacterium liquefaciens]EQM81636.1 hypothetical protein L687_14195 [Microbacterium maritypicum MF109]
MSRSVLLLRAVNVSGRNRVPMARLRELLTAATELNDVSTYIASGNIICETPEHPAATCAAVRMAIHDEFGVDTPVIHRTHAQLVSSESAQPFPEGDVKSVHAMFLEGAPSGDGIEALQQRLRDTERIALIGDDLWIDYGAGGVHSTKLTKTVLDRALGVAGTARNLRTTRTLIELTA